MPDECTQPTAQEMRLADVLAALADDHRRHVVRELVRSEDGTERTCTSFGLPVSKSTRSHHFKVLREAGLVHQVDRGNMSGVTLRRDDVERRFPGLLALVEIEDGSAG